MTGPIGTKKTKTGGRKKGTPNRRTAEFHEALQDLNLDVPLKLAELLPSLEPAKQADLCVQLLPYLYPRRKALEMNSSVSVTIADLIDLQGSTHPV
jgi:hypothetical protein